MKKTITWIARGGIAIALVLLVISVWPAGYVTQSQGFELSRGASMPAVIRFRAPETVRRGAPTDFTVFLDLESMLETGGDVNLVMVYRLELDGAEIVPDAVYQIPLSGVKHQETSWSVSLPLAGEYEGKWWVYLERVSNSGESIERDALFAKQIQIESRGILGMSVTGVRWMSMGLILLGLGEKGWSRSRKRHQGYKGKVNK